MELFNETRVVFDEEYHTYLLDGERILLGVTSILKKHGLSPSEYGSISPEVLEKAAFRGTAVHHLLEDYDNGKPVAPYDVIRNDEVLLSKTSFDKCFKAYKKLSLPVVASEYLISDDDIVASSIDKVVATEEEGVFDLGDIKTSSSIHRDTYSWQLSIYAYLFELRNPGVRVRNLYVIWVRDEKAKIVFLPRVPNEKVKALLQAEKEGRIYSDASVTDAELLSDDEVFMLSTSIERIAELEAIVKEVNEAISSLKDRLYNHMVEQDLDTLPLGPQMVAKLKRPYETTRLDAKKVKALAPEIYEQCTTTSQVKGGITITAK